MDKPPKTPQIGVKIKSGRGLPGGAALLRLRGSNYRGHQSRLPVIVIVFGIFDTYGHLVATVIHISQRENDFIAFTGCQ